MHGISDFDNGPTNKLTETFLIAKFFAQGDAAYEDDLLSKNLDLEYLTYDSNIRI